MCSQYILIASADVESSYLLKIYLTSQDYTVDVTNLGKGTIASLTKRLPDVILLDDTLEDIRVDDLAQQLRSVKGTEHIPIVFLTTELIQEKISDVELDADDWITKPFDIEQLKLQMQNAIKASRQLKKHPSNRERV
ncbi:MAG: response regulator [Chloroflexota bacterium]